MVKRETIGLGPCTILEREVCGFLSLILEIRRIFGNNAMTSGRREVSVVQSLTLRRGELGPLSSIIEAGRREL